MRQPRIDWQGQKLFFHDTDGGVWRVYDCAVSDDRSRAIPLSDPRAAHRAFVDQNGTRRIFPFAGAGSRAISPQVLERQLRAAEGVRQVSARDATLDLPTDDRASSIR